MVRAELVHPVRHGPADDVAGREIAYRAVRTGRVQVIPFRVTQAGTGPPQRLGGQGPRVPAEVHAGRVELHELKVGHLRPRPQGRGQPVAAAGAAGWW